MKISIKNVKQQKIVSEKRTLLSLSDGSDLMIRAADYTTMKTDYRNKTLILFEYSSKIQEIIVTKGLNDEFLLTDWPILLKRNKKERFYYHHTIDYYYHLTHYYKGEEIFDYRNECLPQRKLIK